MNDFTKLKQDCYDANMQLPKLNLVLFTFGNVSVVDSERNVFAIKPSGVAYDNLTVEQIVIVDLDGETIIEGNLRPSSDTKTHAVLYRTWPEIGAIVHTHSTYGTAWAQAQRAIPIFGTTHADYNTVDIPCTTPMNDAMIKGNYELETGHQIINHFAENNLSYKEVEMVLVGNHAPFTWGKNGDKAVHNAAVLEQIAKMALLTEQINANASRLTDTLKLKHYERKHGPDSYYGQSL